MQFVVPMFEATRDGPSGIFGYIGLFDSVEEARQYQIEYNDAHSIYGRVPDYYIVAQTPIQWTGQDYTSVQ